MMQSHLRIMHLTCCLVWASAVVAPAFAGEGRAIMSGLTILTPDDPNSTATVVGANGQEVVVRVVTLAQESPFALLVENQPDPSLPSRVAQALATPWGERIDVNIVEIDLRVAEERQSLRATRSQSEWIVNQDLPFTLQTEVEAALRGETARLPRGSVARDSVDAVCFQSGEPVVELFVWFNSSAMRTMAPQYGLQFVEVVNAPPPQGPSDPPGGTGGTGGTGPGTGGGGTGTTMGDTPPTGDGADPIGSPDRKPK